MVSCVARTTRRPFGGAGRELYQFDRDEVSPTIAIATLVLTGCADFERLLLSSSEGHSDISTQAWRAGSGNQAPGTGGTTFGLSGRATPTYLREIRGDRLEGTGSPTAARKTTSHGTVNGVQM